jgi:tetratricopeptide (TPR) repeat protein
VHTLETAAQRRGARHRVVDHYLHTARAAALIVNPHRRSITAIDPPVAGVTVGEHASRDQAVAWFTAEHRVLVTAVSMAARNGFDAHAWPLALSLTAFLDQAGHWHDRVAVDSIAVAAADRRGDRRAQALSHGDLGRAQARLGRYADARHELGRAIDLFGELNDATGLAHAHHSLASVFEREGLYRAGLRHAEQSLRIFEQIADDPGVAEALNAVGWLMAQMGEHRRSLAYCRRALALQQKLGDRYGEAGTWDSIGFALHRLGHHSLAIGCYRRAITLYEPLGALYFEATTLGRLGDAHSAARDEPAAATAWRRALAHLEALGHPDAEAFRVRLSDRLAPEANAASPAAPRIAVRRPVNNR